MAAHRNIWSPDHCQCQIEFEFDDEVEAEQRVHTAVRIIKKCPAHSTSDIMDRHEHYDIVLKENQTKNKIYGHFLETFPEHTEEIVDDVPQLDTIQFKSPQELLSHGMLKSNKERPKKLKAGVQYAYAFEGTGKNRKIHVKFVGVDIPENKKKLWEKQLHSHVGHDKVLVL